MSPVWIRPRVNADGSKSYQVLYRRGGRGYRIEAAGSFRGWPSGKRRNGAPAAALTTAEQDAKKRRDLVAGWLAVGLDPRVELAKLTATERPARTREQWRDAFLDSRHDIGEKSRRTYRFGIDAVFSVLPDKPLEQTTGDDCAAAVAQLVGKYAPKTIGTYWLAFTMLLYFAGVDPNPAKDRRVRLPQQKGAPPTPPSREHVETILGRIADKYLLPFVLIEQTAVRVETIEELVWENVDLPGAQIRVLEKGRKYRWVPLPDWLAVILTARVAPDERQGRVFPTVTAGGLRGAMRTVCKAAGIPHYHPHDLRHRRASLWHLQGVPDAVLAQRVGHERASFTKDVYAHVMPVDEVPVARLRELVGGAA
jgi:integrase